MASLLSSLGGICHSTGNKGGQKIIKCNFLEEKMEFFALSPELMMGGIISDCSNPSSKCLIFGTAEARREARKY